MGLKVVGKGDRIVKYCRKIEESLRVMVIWKNCTEGCYDQENAKVKSVEKGSPKSERVSDLGALIRGRLGIFFLPAIG